MKLILIFAASVFCISSFATSPKMKRKPAQASAKNLKSVAKQDGQCLTDYARVFNAQNAIQKLSEAQSKYLTSATDVAKALAADTEMADQGINKAISSELHDLGFGDVGAKVTLCDDRDPGQANCLKVYFATTRSSTPGAPRATMVVEDWHTGGTAFYSVCQ